MVKRYELKVTLADSDAIIALLAEAERDAAIGRLVRLKLTSGNDVPVDRCVITAAEVRAADSA